MKAAYDIFHDAVNKMVDHACDASDEEMIRDCIKAEDGVLRVDELRTREFGNKIYVDVEIACDPNCTRDCGTCSRPHRVPFFQGKTRYGPCKSVYRNQIDYAFSNETNFIRITCFYKFYFSII